MVLLCLLQSFQKTVFRGRVSLFCMKIAPWITKPSLQSDQSTSNIPQISIRSFKTVKVKTAVSSTVVCFPRTFCLSVFLYSFKYLTVGTTLFLKVWNP